MAKKAAKAARKTAKKPVVKAAAKKAAPPKPRAKTASRPAAQRADFKKPGKAAIDVMPEAQRKIAQAVDRVIRASVPGVTSLVKWGNPCYYLDDRAFAAMMATRSGVNLALPGAIPDPHRLLEGTGKSMRHVKLADVAAARSSAVQKLITAAAKVGLDRM